jgi:hypothetical protein
MAKHILSRRKTEKPVRPPGAHRANGYTLCTEKLEQREKAFVLYRDMGKARGLNALERELKAHHPEIAASAPSLQKWSKAHQWAERVKQHDIAQDALLARSSTHPQVSAEFDQVDKLTEAAHLAITRALQGTPMVTKPSDLKTLVDAAANALKMAEAIRAKQGDGASRDQIVAEITGLLDLAEARRRMDAVDALRQFGTTEEQMLARGLRKEDGVRIDMSMQAIPSQLVAGDGEVEVDPGEEPTPADMGRSFLR